MTDIVNIAVRLTSADLVGVSEIRELILRAISKDRVEELTFRDDFPAPAAILAQGDVWLADEVEAWFGAHAAAVAGLFRVAPEVNGAEDRRRGR